MNNHIDQYLLKLRQEITRYEMDILFRSDVHMSIITNRPYPKIPRFWLMEFDSLAPYTPFMCDCDSKTLNRDDIYAMVFELIHLLEDEYGLTIHIWQTIKGYHLMSNELLLWNRYGDIMDRCETEFPEMIDAIFVDFAKGQQIRNQRDPTDLKFKNMAVGRCSTSNRISPKIGSDGEVEHIDLQYVHRPTVTCESEFVKLKKVYILYYRYYVLTYIANTLSTTIDVNVLTEEV